MITQTWTYLRRSLTDISWYAEMIKGPWVPTLGYAFLGLIMITISGTAQLRWKAFPQLLENLTASKAEVVTHYPADLVIGWDGNTLSSSQEAVYLNWPDWVQTNQDLPQSFAVISPGLDESQPGSFAEQLDFSILMVITDSHILVNRAENWTELPLSDIPNLPPFEFTQATIESNLDQALQLFQSAFESYWPWLSMFVFGYVVLELATMSLVYSFFVWSLNWLSAVKLTWLESLKLTIHLVVISAIIEAIASWISRGDISYLGPMAFWILLMLIYHSIRPQLLK